MNPKFLHHNTQIGDKLWICGTGNKDARVMFLAPNVLEEEASTVTKLSYGKETSRTPKLLDCGHGVLLQRLALREGIKLNDCWYTTIIKYLPEDKRHRSKPPKTLIDEAWPYIEAEIERVQPDIIVAVGKLAFDQLVDFKAKEADICGAWFYSKTYKAKIYMIPHITQVAKPEKYERYVIDFRAIKTMLDGSENVEDLQPNTTVVRNSNELKDLVRMLQANNSTVLSVDCEWEGNQHVDGKLRSLQIAWNETDAAYIRFMDDKLNYVFDVSYAEAGKILAEWCDRPEVKYIGHHVSADLMWMSHWLGLSWYKKAIFDTEFALQCCDESLDLGLDMLALRYTNFGKYDWDLIWWRKQHPDKRGNGYGLVPDDILIPYGIRDVLTVYRAWGPIAAWLERQDLSTYYNEILNPFVTDVFTFFGLKGLPIDRTRMDTMRDLYQWAKRELERNFSSIMAEEAERLLEQAVRTAVAQNKSELDVTIAVKLCKSLVQDGKVNAAREQLQAFVGPAKWFDVLDTFDHFVIAPDFNIRSKPQMQRWLFDVKKYTPVKSTANKAEGIPAVDSI